MLRRLFAIDPRSLALFRIAHAALLFSDLAQRWPFLDSDLSDAGYFPRVLAGEVTPLLSLCRWSGALGFEPHRIAHASRGPGTLREPNPIRVERVATQRCDAPVGE